ADDGGLETVDQRRSAGESPLIASVGRSEKARAGDRIDVIRVRWINRYAGDRAGGQPIATRPPFAAPRNTFEKRTAAARACRTCGREIARIGLPRDVSVVIDVERHTESAVEAVTADIGRIDQRGACRIELGYEGVSAARQGPLQRASGYREI